MFHFQHVFVHIGRLRSSGSFWFLMTSGEFVSGGRKNERQWIRFSRRSLLCQGKSLGGNKNIIVHGTRMEIRGERPSSSLSMTLVFPALFLATFFYRNSEPICKCQLAMIAWGEFLHIIGECYDSKQGGSRYHF